MYDEYIKNPRSELRNDLQALFNFESPEQSIKRLVTLVFHNRYGGIAQLGEHLLCKQGVCGSIPHISTNNLKRLKIWVWSEPNGKMGL